MYLDIASALLIGAKHRHEGLDTERWQSRNRNGAARAELHRDTGDDLVARSFHDIYEVEAAEGRILGGDAAAHRLDLLVDRGEPFRALFEGLAPFVGEGAEEDVG